MNDATLEATQAAEREPSRVRPWEPPLLRAPKKTLEVDEQALLQVSRTVEHLRGQLAEMDRREQDLNAQLAAFDQEQRTFRLHVRDSEERLAERERTLHELDARAVEKQAIYERRLAEVGGIEQELARLREELAIERAGLKESLEAEVLAQRQAFAREQEEFFAARAAHEQAAAEWEARRAAEDLSLQQQREQLTAEHESHCESLERERIDLEKRTRFHEDHLTLFRGELEGTRTDLERDRQRQRVWKERVEESLRLRIAHVRRFRDLLEQREESVVRAEEALQSDRRRLAFEQQEAQTRLDKEHAALAELQDRSRGELRRQQDLLQAHSRSLDQRRARLDALRDELEHAHRDVLEQRMTLEQAAAALADEHSQEEAGHRVEQARKALLEFHQGLRTAIEGQRQELDESRRQLQEKRVAFRDERETLAEWLQERETDLTRREARVQEQLEGLHQREQAWRQARDSWRQERTTAEGIIRDLVVQLETALEQIEAPPSYHGDPADIALPTAA
jgi:chromosome segregation ATPase